MTNFNWRHTDNVLELGIGVSCCPKPTEETLSDIWARTRPGLISLLNSLQGKSKFDIPYRDYLTRFFLRQKILSNGTLSILYMQRF